MVPFIERLRKTNVCSDGSAPSAVSNASIAHVICDMLQVPQILDTNEGISFIVKPRIAWV
jgi:hypothetical protein